MRGPVVTVRFNYVISRTQCLIASSNSSKNRRSDGVQSNYKAPYCNFLRFRLLARLRLGKQESAHQVQSSFVGHHRQEVMIHCDPETAINYYRSLIGRSIYAQHAEIEEYVQIHPTHPVLDRENTLIEGVDTAQERYEAITLSLVTRTGEPGTRSGLNWGQRPGRNPNEAYIPLPAKIAKSGFFPLEKRHFTAITDDRHQLILRIEQQNDKAITTPARNSDLGEYFRNRLGLANGAFVNRADLERYGRTDVVFIKLDEETCKSDFFQE